MPDQVVTPAKAVEKKKLVLVAEDDAFYGNVFKTKLAKEGYDVVVAVNGKKALELAAERVPDLMLLDLVMPVMDGFETLQSVKADEKLKNVPVIILSNLGQDSDVEKAKKLGAKDYFVKSNVSIQKVVEIVKANL
ncbi:MAG: response regulator [Candidatus Pacebacteria bacterium]|nr:response regulator [Candidatus Paceibacterota bacterium]